MTEDGQRDLTLDFGFVKIKEDTKVPEKDKGNGSPITRDSTPIFSYLLVILVAVVGLVFTRKRYRLEGR